MLKQKFCLVKASKNNALFGLSCALIILFGFAIILPTVPEKTHAEGDSPNEGIIITISPEINASLISSENGDYKIIKDTVTVGTDALNGYTLYISTDTAEHQTLYLDGDTSSENKINGTNGTYEEPKTLGNYEWGFAVPGVSHFDDTYSAESPNTESKFAILPLENKIIRDYTTSASEDAAEVYYGFKLGGTIEPGAYETNITYTAIPATQPLTAKAILGDNNNLNFLYDRNVYMVGETYTDNIGETTIANVYDNIPMGGITADDFWPWTEHSDTIFTANFDKSFANARLTSTLRWFRDLKKLSNITNHQNLNTSMVSTMYQMFAYTGNDVAAFNLDLSGWDTSNVVDMSYVFARAGESSETFNLNINGWDTGNVTSFYAMFYRSGFSATNWNIGDLSGWDTSNATSFHGMFNRAGNSATTFDIGNLDDWKTGNVVNMNSMFGQAGASATVWNIGDIGSWDTNNVTDMSWMFNQAGRDAEVWNIGDLGSWNTGAVMDMSYMFPDSGHNAATWDIGDISGWDTSKVTNMCSMFEWAGKNATSWNAGDLSGWNIDSVTNHDRFADWTQTNIDFSKLPWQSD